MMKGKISGNISIILTSALDAELKCAAAVRWKKNNADAITAMNHTGEASGCFSAKWRSF